MGMPGPRLPLPRRIPIQRKSSCRVLFLLFSLPEIFVDCNIILKLMNEPFLLFSESLFFVLLEFVIIIADEFNNVFSNKELLSTYTMD